MTASGVIGDGLVAGLMQQFSRETGWIRARFAPTFGSQGLPRGLVKCMAIGQTGWAVEEVGEWSKSLDA